MPRRSPILSQLRLDLMALLIVGLVGTGYYLHLSPIIIHSTDAEVPGLQPLPGPSNSDTLLVLPQITEETPAAESFSSLDMAFGWYNILGQELGNFRHVSASQLSAVNLSDTRFVVIAASSARNMTLDQIQVVGQWVERGGVLLIEQPDKRWNGALGFDIGNGSIRPARRVSAADGIPARGALRDALLNTPLSTTILTSVPREAPGTRVVMEVDGRPALLHHPHGSGHNYVLAIDLARAITTMQQGRPQDDFSLPPVDDENIPGNLTQPQVLVSSEKMLETSIPHADLLERNILEVVSAETPLPRFWYFPGKSAGVYIMSHDEEAFGDKSLFVTDWEHQQGERSSNFIIPGPMTAEAMQKMRDQGHDLQLHWHRGFQHDYVQIPAGLGPWKPFRMELNLRDQRSSIERKLQGSPVMLNRIHGLVWDQDWSSTFRKMAAAQIAADSSYGPTGPKQFGYLFGTGFPFYPLDKSGLLIPVAEVPFVLQDDENLSPSRHRRLIKRSESGFHEVIMPIFHSNTMANKPSVKVIQSWREIFAFARKHNHWVTTLREYLLFEEARRSSTLTSRFIPTERRLEIQVETVRPLTGPKPKTRKERTSLYPRSKRKKEKASEPELGLCPSLAFPQNYDGSGVESVRVDGTPVPLKRIGRSGDGFFHTLKLSCGKHTIHVVYAGRVIEKLSE